MIFSTELISGLPPRFAQPAATYSSFPMNAAPVPWRPWFKLGHADHFPSTSDNASTSACACGWLPLSPPITTIFPSRATAIQPARGVGMFSFNVVHLPAAMSYTSTSGTVRLNVCFVSA